jgi:gliding motility-associated-like protein
MMRDTCDNFSETGKLACSILLKGNSLPFEHNLSWTPYNYWANGTKVYEILRQDQQNPFMVLYTNPSSQLSLNDDKLNRKSGIYQYAIVAQEEQGDAGPFFGASSLSNEITLIQSPLLHVPNAFTANRDGLNDEWGIRDVFVKDYHLRVYNRWGQLIFETKDKDVQWKGESDNTDINQSDVYVYLVTYTGWDGSSKTLRGNVTVIR